MGIKENDWIDLLEFTRRRIKEYGLSEIDERVISNFVPEKCPSRNLLRYLDRVISILSDRSFRLFDRALELLNESIQVEGGGTVQGIEVIFTEQDRLLYGVQKFDLSGVDSALVEELRLLSRYLEQRIDK